MLNMVQVVANNDDMVLMPSIVEVYQGSTSSGGQNFGQVMPAQNYQIRSYGVWNQNEAFLCGGQKKFLGCEKPNPPPDDLHKAGCCPGWMKNKVVVCLHKEDPVAQVNAAANLPRYREYQSNRPSGVRGCGRGKRNRRILGIGRGRGQGADNKQFS